MHVSDSGAPTAKTIGLVAHDHRKHDLIASARYNFETLAQHRLLATATTGMLLEGELELDVRRLKSGPLGGNQQLGALIAEGDIDLLLSLWDRLAPLPRDPDVKALLRISVVWNLPVACNRATADYLISTPLVAAPYRRELPDDGDLDERLAVRVDDRQNPLDGNG